MVITDKNVYCSEAEEKMAISTVIRRKILEMIFSIHSPIVFYEFKK
jgi:hypothetical protein